MSAAPKAASGSTQFMLRSALTLGSLFTGSSIAHHLWKPDMVRRRALFLFVLALRFPSYFLSAHTLSLCRLFLRSQTLPDLSKASEPPPPPALVEGFVASNTFAGAKPGFVFKRDVNGLGYYPDARSS